MYPYAPPETVLRHLAEQTDRDRRNPHRATRSRVRQDDRDRSQQHGQK